MRAPKARGVLGRGVRGHASPESFEILESQKRPFPGFWERFLAILRVRKYYLNCYRIKISTLLHVWGF